jgi:tetratricopeptide (TPR) repeat protein
MDIWFRERPARAVTALDAAIARTPLRTMPEYDRPYLDLASLYALAGRPDRAHTMLAQYAAEAKDSALIRSREPDRHNALGEIALAEQRPLDAVNEFRLGDRLPDGPASECTQCLLASLGRAYDAANMPDSAITSYERYIATPNSLKLMTDSRYLAGIHKRLGELYEGQGEREKAVSHYLQFVHLWNTADAELQPKVAEAKRRLAALGRSASD